MDPADLTAKIGPATRLVWLEAAGSITLEFPDLPALAAQVRSANEGPGAPHRERARQHLGRGTRVLVASTSAPMS